ncbi:MAG: nitroreductase [Nitrososphaerota archaeon]|jgi:nitroreductase|nr:nitroreductase [Nitrososphaerota archaeon]
MDEIIRKRKSIRKYEKTPLDDVTLSKIETQITNVKPLYPDIKYSIKITNKLKGLFGITSPHYLVFCSDEKEGYLENIGFIGQQLDLFFSKSGLGSCWLGMAKPQEKNTQPLVICMAFGKPAEPLHRNILDFKRKSLSTISEGTDKRLEAARLAPSGMNAQNWYFIAQPDKIHCYRKKPTFSFAPVRLGCIDLGIALCHIAKESEQFTFIKEDNSPQRKNCIYMGTVVKQ